MKKSLLLTALTIMIGIALCFVPADRTEPVAASPASPSFSDALIYGSADALVLTCMDYRLTDETAHFFQSEMGMTNKYDYVVLAGASLGVNNTKYPNWGKTFWEHLDTAIALHGIHEVIVMDHRNCGAYKLLLNKDFPADATPTQLKEETAVHKEQLDSLAKTIHEKYPKLDVVTLIMGLDGHVEEIGHIRVAPSAAEKH